MSKGYLNLAPGETFPEDLASLPLLVPFSDILTGFVQDFSETLMRHNSAKLYPELMALAYWMRRSNIQRLRGFVKLRQGDALLVPRGTVFHVAPSNVDTIFVYSWLLSLLTGNRNIVRISSKPSPQSEELMAVISSLLADSSFSELASQNLFVRYVPNPEITASFSRVCDVRVIWGGDETVRTIRQAPLPPTSIEIAFADKYSLAIVNLASWIRAPQSQKDSWVAAFLNDAYWFNQMACSSPRLLLWVGEEQNARLAASEFWPMLERLLVGKQRRFGDADYVNKLVAADCLAIESQVEIPSTESNDVVRIWLKEPRLHEKRHCGAGLFFESCLPDLGCLNPLLSRKIQTVTYAGYTKNQIAAFVKTNQPVGIDRFVPFGQALDFTPVWDGIDIPRAFMREVVVN